jgi:hypothetical protein
MLMTVNLSPYPEPQCFIVTGDVTAASPTSGAALLAEDSTPLLAEDGTALVAE